MRIRTDANTEVSFPATQDHVELVMMVCSVHRIPDLFIGCSPCDLDMEGQSRMEGMLWSDLIGELSFQSLACEFIATALDKLWRRYQFAAIEGQLPARIECGAKVRQRPGPSPQFDRIAIGLLVVGHRHGKWRQRGPYLCPEFHRGAWHSSGGGSQHRIGSAAIRQSYEGPDPCSGGGLPAKDLSVVERECRNVLLLKIRFHILQFGVENVAVGRTGPVELQRTDRKKELQFLESVALAARRKMRRFHETEQTRERVVLVVIRRNTWANRNDFGMKNLHGAFL